MKTVVASMNWSIFSNPNTSVMAQSDFPVVQHTWD